MLLNLDLVGSLSLVSFPGAVHAIVAGLSLLYPSLVCPLVCTVV